MKTFELVEDIHVQLLPDGPGVIPPHTFTGQRFKYKGRTCVIVHNTQLTWTVRYLTLWEKLNEYLCSFIVEKLSSASSSLNTKKSRT